MADVLVVAELADGQIRKTTLSAITMAKAAAAVLGGGFDILVIGGPGAKAAAAGATAFGAGKVLVAEDAGLTDYVAERYAPTVADVGKGYGLICATASSYGKDLIPRVAGRLEAAFAGDCAGVSDAGGKIAYKRPMFAGNAFGTCTLNTAIQTATARQSEIEPAAESGGASPISDVTATAPSGAAERVEFVSLEQVKSERPELGEASTVVSGGRALKEEFFKVLEPLVDVLGSALGASRAACDAGYAPGDYQVGQTGKIVAPDLYFAIGISGAIQHVAGMKSSKTIVAINKDPDAPIFQIADYGLVADLFQAVPELVEALKAKKAAG